MRLELPAMMRDALPVVDRLRAHGHEAVFVGGAVRDTLLGLSIKDVDIATSALPEQTASLFERTIPTGIQHGTVTVMENGLAIEVTTYRSESGYEGHRRPQSVSYIASLDDDLLRRDFTVNAIALRADGQLHDPFGGQADLRRKLLRPVGDADSRLREDALRMLRAIRFIGAYGLKPAPSLWRALVKQRELLRHIAMERVQSELDKMLAGPKPERSFIWLAASGLLKETAADSGLGAALEGACCSDGSLSRLDELYDGLSGIARLDDPDARWSALLIALGFDGERARKALAALRCSRQRVDAATATARLQQWALAAEVDGTLHTDWKQVLRFGEKSVRRWLLVARSLGERGDGRLGAGVLQRMEDRLDQMPAKKIGQLAVTGFDLQRGLNREAGPWLGDMLQRLLGLVASGDMPNSRDRLLAQAEIWNDEVPDDEL